MDLNEIRRFYAEEIEAVANIRSRAIVEALARVPLKEVFKRLRDRLKQKGYNTTAE